MPDARSFRAKSSTSGRVPEYCPVKTCSSTARTPSRPMPPVLGEQSAPQFLRQVTATHSQGKPAGRTRRLNIPPQCLAHQRLNTAPLRLGTASLAHSGVPDGLNQDRFLHPTPQEERLNGRRRTSFRGANMPLTSESAVQAALVHALTLSFANILWPSDHQLTPEPADKRCC